MKPKILILGKTGMLGSMVADYLSQNPQLYVAATSRKNYRNKYFFDAEKFISTPDNFSFIKNFDYIINCIGIIKPHCQENNPLGIKQAISINAFFPHKLTTCLEKSPTKIIQIATDCVYSGIEGKYHEKSFHDPQDIYGKSKSLGEVKYSPNFLNIRCSIIGPEQKNHFSLLDWFLTQPDNSIVHGYQHHLWNGVTTLQFARLTENIILQKNFEKLRSINHTHHFVPNNTVSKYQLLKIIKQKYKKDITIKPVNKPSEKIHRTLTTNFSALENLFPKSNIRTALTQLKKYLETNETK